MSTYIFLNAVRNQRGAQLYLDRQIAAGFSLFAIRQQLLKYAENSREEATVKGARLVLKEIRRANGQSPAKLIGGALFLLLVAVLIIVFILMVFGH